MVKPQAVVVALPAPEAQPASQRRVIDWEAIEVHYRAGLRSLKDIGKEFDVSDAAIIKRAKRDDWPRDLKAKIKAKADAKVSAAQVSKEVSEKTRLTEAIVVEANAMASARIQLTQRADVGRSRLLVMRLLAELEHHTEDGDVFQQLQELVSGESEDEPTDRSRKLHEAYQRAMSLSSRTKTMKDLADALKTLVMLERLVYGIDGIEPDAVDERSIDDNELARRIAFALAKATHRGSP